MNGRRRVRTGALALLLLAVGACGSIAETAPPPGMTGPACTSDAECVPNGCCGNGTGAVHITGAPVCNLACTNLCPTNQVSCGCGIPVCRNSRCTVAVSGEPRCHEDAGT